MLTMQHRHKMSGETSLYLACPDCHDFASCHQLVKFVMNLQSSPTDMLGSVFTTLGLCLTSTSEVWLLTDFKTTGVQALVSFAFSGQDSSVMVFVDGFEIAVLTETCRESLLGLVMLSDHLETKRITVLAAVSSSLQTVTHFSCPSVKFVVQRWTVTLLSICRAKWIVLATVFYSFPVVAHIEKIIALDAGFSKVNFLARDGPLGIETKSPQKTRPDPTFYLKLTSSVKPIFPVKFTSFVNSTALKLDRDEQVEEQFGQCLRHSGLPPNWRQWSVSFQWHHSSDSTTTENTASDAMAAQDRESEYLGKGSTVSTSLETPLKTSDSLMQSLSLCARVHKADDLTLIEGTKRNQEKQRKKLEDFPEANRPNIDTLFHSFSLRYVPTTEWEVFICRGSGKFQDERARLASFYMYDKVPPSGVWLTKVAAAGFYCPDRQSLFLLCAFCEVKVEISKFINRNPMELHSIKPVCPLVIGTPDNKRIEQVGQVAGLHFSKDLTEVTREESSLSQSADFKTAQEPAQNTTDNSGQWETESGYSSGAQSSLGGFSSSGTSSLSGFTSAGTSSLSGFISTGTSSSSGFTSTGTSSSSGFTSTGTSFLSGFTSAGASSLSGFTSSGTSSLSGFTSTGTSSLSGFTSAGASSSSGFISTGTSSSSGFTSAGTSSLSGFTSAGTSSLSGFISTGTSSSSGFTSTGTSSSSGFTSSGTSSLSGFTSAGASSLSGFTSSGTSSLSGFTSTGTSSLSGFTSDGASSSSGFTSAGTSSLSGFTSAGTDSRSSPAPTPVDTRQQELTSIPQNAISGVPDSPRNPQVTQPNSITSSASISTPALASQTSTSSSSTPPAVRQVVTYSQLGIYTQEPKRPDLAIVSARVNTFTGWPHADSHPPEDMAEAGFYYVGQADLVRCFYCKGGLKSWAGPQQPWVEHARYYPKCPFVGQVKGQEFVDVVLELKERQESISTSEVENELKSRHSRTKYTDEQALIARLCAKPAEALCGISGAEGGEQDLNGLAKRADELENENEKITSGRTCKICQTNYVSILFLPCGHLVSCAQCAPALRTCAICRQRVKGRVRVIED